MSSSALTKNQESLIRALYTRHGRKKHDLCVCEGARCCSEFLAYAPGLMEFAVASEDFDVSRLHGMIEPIRVSAAEFVKLSATVAGQGILIVARKPQTIFPDSLPPPSDFIVVLDKVGDPGNFGTILRTARALGLKELAFTSGSVDPFSDKVIRSAMAAQFSLRLREFPDMSETVRFLKLHSYRHFFRTDPHQGANCFTESALFDKSAIIFGSEGQGAADFEGALPLTIPMPGDYESINVAQAATVILFEHVRRRSV